MEKYPGLASTTDDALAAMVKAMLVDDLVAPGRYDFRDARSLFVQAVRAAASVAPDLPARVAVPLGEALSSIAREEDGDLRTAANAAFCMTEIGLAPPAHALVPLLERAIDEGRTDDEGHAAFHLARSLGRLERLFVADG